VADYLPTEMQMAHSDAALTGPSKDQLDVCAAPKGNQADPDHPGRYLAYRWIEPPEAVELRHVFRHATFAKRSLEYRRVRIKAWNQLSTIEQTARRLPKYVAHMRRACSPPILAFEEERNNWFSLYKAALQELDIQVMQQRILVARNVLHERLRQLQTAPNHYTERLDLEYAIRNLYVAERMR
jgi:hypothetical protein